MISSINNTQQDQQHQLNHVYNKALWQRNQSRGGGGEHNVIRKPDFAACSIEREREQEAEAEAE